MSAYLRRPSYLLASLLTASCAAAQQTSPPPEGLAEAVAIHDLIQREGAWLGPAIWPGFRPDTVWTHYLVPGVGKAFAHRAGATPRDFRRWPGRQDLSWADTGRVSFEPGRIAFLTVAGEPTDMLALAIHEQFHEFEKARAAEGAAFGRRENAFDVVGYPVFDAANEAGFALEGRLLSEALRATEAAVATARVREFVAARRARQAALADEYVAFERDTELNEGLAQYSGLEALRQLEQRPEVPWKLAAAGAMESEMALLDRIIDNERSVRRRFYTTGSAQAFLLDRLAPGWKERLSREDATLTSLLGEAVNASRHMVNLEEVRRRAGAGLGDMAAARVAELRRDRAARRDSILAAPGIRLRVISEGRGFEWCGFDPQNTLATAAGEVLHTRWLRLCRGGVNVAEFDVPLVETVRWRELITIVPADVVVRTAAGEHALSDVPSTQVPGRVVIEHGPVTIDAAHATIQRAPREVIIVMREGN